VVGGGKGINTASNTSAALVGAGGVLSDCGSPGNGFGEPVDGCSPS
jgi:hypothetical protein